MAKGEVSFEQWSYELQTLRKSYSNSAIREGIQCSLRRSAADAVCNMGPNVPLDMILKKFTMTYGNVKSFDLLMRDFYRADQGEAETIPSFATRIEGLLSQIRDRFPNQLPHQEVQRLLKDCLFHGSRKSIWDSVKYCFADASVDYMQFLEECRKSEDEGKAGQAKTATRAKVKAAAATLPPIKEDEVTKQLKYQQHQTDALVGQVKNLVLLVRATQPSSGVVRTGNPPYGAGDNGKEFQGTGRGWSWGRGQPSQPRTTFQPKVRSSQQEQGAAKTYKPNQCWQCGEVGHLKRDCPTLKGKGLFPGGILKQPSRTEKAFPK